MQSRIFHIMSVVVILAIPLFAQAPPDPSPAIEAVKQVTFLEGNWSGEGWMQMGQGSKEEFTQVETVEMKLDGAVLLIEGIGHSKGENPKKIHHALALVSFDPEDKNLVFSSFVAGRQRLEVVPQISENTFIWSFSPPNGGQIRYSIQVINNTWDEAGEYSRDGQTWYKFFEMHLKKQ